LFDTRQGGRVNRMIKKRLVTQAHTVIDGKADHSQQNECTD